MKVYAIVYKGVLVKSFIALLKVKPCTNISQQLVYSVIYEDRHVGFNGYTKRRISQYVLIYHSVVLKLLI